MFALCLGLLGALPVVSSTQAAANDWLTLPSQYTHDPATGLRISQYAAVANPTAPMAVDFRTSGYTHTRSTLNYGQSADNYHRVEQWGEPVRPYGEWRFPYRPYSVPYGAWGPPFGGLNLGGFNVFGGVPGQPGIVPGVPGGFQPGAGGFQPGAGGVDPYPITPGSPYPNAPYFDGYHPVYRE